jgi:outer membrane protein
MKKIILIFTSIVLLSNFAYAEQAVDQQSTPIIRSVYTLDDLYKLAFERSEKIKISEENLYISEREKDRALAALLPTLSAYWNTTQYNESKIRITGVAPDRNTAVLQPDSSYSWGLRLDQSFSLSFRELTAFSISKENIVKSGYDLSVVRESYLLDVSNAYYGLLRAKESLDIANAEVERLTKYRDAAKVRLKVGEVTKTAVLRAEAELSGAQSTQIIAKNGSASAKALLARVVGLEGDFDIKETSKDIQDATAVNSAAALDSMKQSAFSERAELKSLEVQKKTAEDQVRYAGGAFWPNLSVEGVYAKNDSYPSPGFHNTESIYGGIKLNFPFFEGGLRVAELREAKARLKQAELSYEDKKKDIGIEVENAYLDLRTQEGILAKFREQVAYAEDNYKAVSKQFEFGLANTLDVIDANTTLVTAERQLADTKYNYQLSALRLQRTTGALLKNIENRIK